MKLGVFDSGLGGLLMAKAIRKNTPDLDIIYFGDTLHLPYGNRSQEAIYDYSKRAIQFLFEQDCALIIVACNTVSASALKRLQQEYLPNSPYKDRRILGIIVPTLEAAIDLGHKKLGLIATNYTINSDIYKEELTKIDPDIEIVSCNTPLLVPLIENKGEAWLPAILEHYLEPLIKQKIECLILGCTHYPYLKNKIKDIIGNQIHILSQDEILPEKLDRYLTKHPYISNQIDKSGKIEFLVSDLNDGYQKAAKQIYSQDIHIEHVQYNHNTQTYIRG